MLIMRTLLHGPLHGYGIAKRIGQMSDDLLKVEEGSLYPALQRLLRNGWVVAEWVPAGPRRRARVYHLTPEGREQFSADAGEFTRVMGAIIRLIQPA